MSAIKKYLASLILVTLALAALCAAEKTHADPEGFYVSNEMFDKFRDFLIGTFEKVINDPKADAREAMRRSLRMVDSLKKGEGQGRRLERPGLNLRLTQTH